MAGPEVSACEAHIRLCLDGSHFGMQSARGEGGEEEGANRGGGGDGNEEGLWGVGPT